MIELRDVTFAYGREPVLHGVSLRVSEGSMLGIIGPNSSGKSTMLRLMAGILRPDRGCVLVGGRDSASLNRREAARRVCFVPQETPSSFPFRALEIVLMGRTPYMPAVSFERERDIAIARKALEDTDTYHLRNRFLDELSGGERQLVIIARALAQEAPVMLLDEPTTFLDMRHRIDVFETVARLNREQNRTIVIVSHDLNLASLYCDRLVLLKSGKIIADGEPREVLREEPLEKSYGVRMEITEGSAGGRPFVIPQRRKNQEGEKS